MSGSMVIFLQALLFYVIFSLFSLIGMYFTIPIFGQIKSISYVTGKFVGFLLFSYAIWLMASLKILNFQSDWIIVGLFFLACAFGFRYLYISFWSNLSLLDRKKIKKSFFYTELAGLFLFFSYLALRWHNAAAFGTERFMDMAMLNASLKTQFFPFIDPWYAGKTVNYYYYGHFLVSLLTKLSGLSSFVTYNFALGWLYSGSFLLATFTVLNLRVSKLFSVLAGFLVTTAGSIFYANCVIRTLFRHQAICSYASSTRLYTPSYIINEIPSYSFTVGDLHAHFIALPFFILNLIFIFQLWSVDKITPRLKLVILFSLLTSALINPSDVTTLGLLTALVWTLKVVSFLVITKWHITKDFKQKFKEWVIFALLLSMGLIFLYLPFFANFQSPVLGFGLVQSFATKHGFWLHGYQVPTPIGAIIGLWGPFFFGFFLAVWYLRKSFKQIIFPLILFILSVFLIIFVEFFYIKDIYQIANPPFFRANTVFKYGYHTWVIFSIAFAAILGQVFQKMSLLKINKWQERIIGTFLILLVCASMFYPYQAIRQFYGGSVSGTLDASEFLYQQSRTDARAIKWINNNMRGRNVVVEAVGESYSYFARISVFTGSITPMGWQSHEWTWRFDGREAEKILATRPNATVETGYGKISLVTEDIRELYETGNVESAKKIIDKYGVKYVYIGGLERATYKNLNEQKFLLLGDLVYKDEDVSIYGYY